MKEGGEEKHVYSWHSLKTKQTEILRAKLTQTKRPSAPRWELKTAAPSLHRSAPATCILGAFRMLPRPLLNGDVQCDAGNAKWKQ